MKITTTGKLFTAVLLVGGLAWAVTSSKSGFGGMQTPQATSARPGAALTAVKLPASLSAEAMTGKTYYEAVCASCHGTNAAGQDGVAPPLVHPLYVSSHHGDAAFVVAARKGVRQHHWPFGSMPPLEQRLTDAALIAIIRHIRELQRENGIL